MCLRESAAALWHEDCCNEPAGQTGAINRICPTRVIFSFLQILTGLKTTSCRSGHLELSWRASWFAALSLSCPVVPPASHVPVAAAQTAAANGSPCRPSLSVGTWGRSGTCEVPRFSTETCPTRHLFLFVALLSEMHPLFPPCALCRGLTAASSGAPHARPHWCSFSHTPPCTCCVQITPGRYIEPPAATPKPPRRFLNPTPSINPKYWLSAS